MCSGLVLVVTSSPVGVMASWWMILPWLATPRLSGHFSSLQFGHHMVDCTHARLWQIQLIEERLLTSLYKVSVWLECLCMCDTAFVVLVTQCMSIVLVHVFKLSMTFFVVPLPNVTIVPDRAGPLYSGTSLNLTCSVQFSSVVDTNISVNISWIGPNGEMLPSTIVAEDPPYNSITTVFLSSNDSGTYSCNATANPVPPMTSIGASETGMATQDLTVIGE